MHSGVFKKSAFNTHSISKQHFEIADIYMNDIPETIKGGIKYYPIKLKEINRLLKYSK